MTGSPLVRERSWVRFPLAAPSSPHEIKEYSPGAVSADRQERAERNENSSSDTGEIRGLSFSDRSWEQSRICGRTYQTETPATAGTGAGADCFSAAQVERYITGADPASFNDTETPQPVVAYVSCGFIYQVDQNLNVVAYGPLTRREVLA